MPVESSSRREHRLARKAAQPAMEVADRAAEEQPADEREDRIAEIAVKRRHGRLRDPAAKTVSHHDVVAFAKLFDEAVEIGEVVGIVAVAHDDVAAARSADAGDKRRAVAAASTATTRAPCARAIAWLPSVEPLSAMKTSPLMPVRQRNAFALSMQMPSVSASFRQGIRIESSIGTGLGERVFDIGQRGMHRIWPRRIGNDIDSSRKQRAS